MALVKCIDCGKMVSEYAPACPNCGCPAQYYLQKAGVTVERVLVDEEIQAVEVLQDSPEVLDVQQETTDIYEDNSVSFSFGNRKITYPPSIRIYAPLYGKYYDLSQKFNNRYAALYREAGNIETVLTTVTKRANEDIRLLAEEATKDLYSCGILIAVQDFMDEYDISFNKYIVSLYQQYKDILQEREELAYQREVEKASRGRWEGGGFGMRGAISGAMKAGVLNVGSDLLHSIGDGITKSGDNRYINNKLDEIYNSESNYGSFSLAAYLCCWDVLDSMREELVRRGIVDRNCFVGPDETTALYEAMTKHEQDHEKIFEGMLNCIKYEPELDRFYTPILKDLFESECEIKEFLCFWNLESVYEELEHRYINEIIGKLENPFIDNRCSFVIQLSGVPSKTENGVCIEGKVIKGQVESNDEVVFLKSVATPLLSANIVQILNEKGAVEYAKIGRSCRFVLNLNNVENVPQSALVVDAGAFEQIEANLYARYEKNGSEVLWGFADEYADEDSAYFTFVQGDGYQSNRGIRFDSTIGDVKAAYGEVAEIQYSQESDLVTSIGNRKKNKDVWVLSSAKVFLNYQMGTQYAIRFYFDDEQKMILVAYLKNVDTSMENEAPQTTVTVERMALQVECPKCGRILNRNTKFCNFCGEPNPLFSVECPSCGKRVKKGIRFCNFCGQNMMNG